MLKKIYRAKIQELKMFIDNGGITKETEDGFVIMISHLSHLVSSPFFVEL